MILSPESRTWPSRKFRTVNFINGHSVSSLWSYNTLAIKTKKISLSVIRILFVCLKVLQRFLDAQGVQARLPSALCKVFPDSALTSLYVPTLRSCSLRILSSLRISKEATLLATFTPRHVSSSLPRTLGGLCLPSLTNFYS